MSVEAQMRMDHGTKSEILLYLRCYHTEGAHIIHSGEKPIMFVSPEGSLGMPRPLKKGVLKMQKRKIWANPNIFLCQNIRHVLTKKMYTHT